MRATGEPLVAPHLGQHLQGRTSAAKYGKKQQEHSNDSAGLALKCRKAQQQRSERGNAPKRAPGLKHFLELRFLVLAFPTNPQTARSLAYTQHTLTCISVEQKKLLAVFTQIRSSYTHCPSLCAPQQAGGSTA